MNLFLQVVLAVLVAVPLGILCVAQIFIVGSIFRWLTSSHAEKIAWSQFKIDYPNLLPSSTTKQRDEDLIIVSVLYFIDRGRSLTKYYAVEAGSNSAKEVEDDSKYRPQWDGITRIWR